MRPTCIEMPSSGLLHIQPNVRSYCYFVLWPLAHQDTEINVVLCAIDSTEHVHAKNKQAVRITFQSIMLVFATCRLPLSHSTKYSNR